MVEKINHKELEIIDVVENTPGTKTIFVDSGMDVEPGRFFMLYLPDAPDFRPDGKRCGKEKPFSVSYIGPLGFTIKKAGPLTEYAHTLSRHDRIQATGPFGNSYLDLYDPDMPVCLIAGGCGAAPLAYWAEYLARQPKAGCASVLLGAESRETLLFEDRFEKACGPGKLTLATVKPADGCKTGTVIEHISRENVPAGSQVYVCGPRGMLVSAALKICDELKIAPQSQVYLSMETYMKCGCGECSSCETAGYKACTDGPHFRYSDLAGEPDFLHVRGKSGAFERNHV